jgi:hypothetical protein
MSDDLFYTRLRWSNGHGIAKYRNRIVVLTEAPDISRDVVVEIIYTPEVGVARVRTFSKPWRDLLPDEIAACDSYLRIATGPGET